ncbi:hypothetical protein AAY473_015710 [Plecturocebus cupreus]
MGLHRVGQAGLELLTSGDPPASASQRAEISEPANSLPAGTEWTISNLGQGNTANCEKESAVKLDT